MHEKYISNQYYLFNAHGDVIQRADAWGNVLKNYRYDAFGNEQNPEKLDSNPFRYCGEYFDRETGEIYLRARYYNSAIGRFGEEDSARSGLNWYCNNNPIMFIDPLGLALVNIDDYTRAMGATTKKYNRDGKKHISVSYGGRSQSYTYYNSGKIDDTVLNSRFGWESFLTESDRKVDVGVAIFEGVLYKDFSIPVNDALNNAMSTFRKNSFNMLWFKNQVNHNKDWDIKRKDPWNRTIANDTYPGNYNTAIVVNDSIVTLEELGNMTYGFLGTVSGYSSTVLLTGGDYAAGGIMGFFT